MSRASAFFGTIRRLFTRGPARDAQPLTQLPRTTLRALEKTLDYRIRNRDLFVQALQHRSFHQRSQHPSRSNERLEFLGDSILNLIVGEHLFHRNPAAQEGDLTKLRSRLVNKKALAAYAKSLRLAEFIFMSPSAAQAGGKGRDTIAADTFEAVVAAIYLDGGYGEATRFVHRQVLAALERGSVITADLNFKSRLLEHAQSHGLGVPRYLLTHQEGPDHDRTFTVEVLLAGTRRGLGTGKNKKEAEQSAAQQALESLADNAHP
jgi:ribonuclease III